MLIVFVPITKSELILNYFKKNCHTDGVSECNKKTKEKT